MHESDVANALASRFFDHVDRIRSGHLEIEPIVGFRGGMVVSVSQFVIDPESAATKEHELAFAKAAQDAFVDDLALELGAARILVDLADEVLAGFVGILLAVALVAAIFPKE